MQNRGVFQPFPLALAHLMDGGRLFEELEAKLRDVVRMDGFILAPPREVHHVPAADVGDLLLRLDPILMALDEVVEQALPDRLVADGQLVEVKPLHDSTEHDSGRRSEEHTSEL